MDPGLSQGALRAELERFGASLKDDLLKSIKDELLLSSTPRRLGIQRDGGYKDNSAELRVSGRPQPVPGSYITKAAGYLKLSPREEQTRSIVMADSYEPSHRKRLTTRLKQDALKHITEEDVPMNSLSQSLLSSSAFHYGMSVVVLINAIIIGIEADWNMRHLQKERHIVFHIIDILFCAVFTSEFAVRVCALGWAGVFSGPDGSWNMLDFTFISLQALELSTLSLNHMKFLRLLRLGRILRVLRIGRSASTFAISAELRMLLISLFSSLRSLLWVMVLLLLTTYSMGVYITQLLADHWTHNKDRLDPDSELNEMFGSLGLSMLTLYEALASGISWRDALQPLMLEVSPWLALPFIMFTGFTLFALLNVVSGLFLNAAVNTAEEDKKRACVDQMRQILAETDKDGSGTISTDEFQWECSQESFELYMRAIDLDIHNATELFNLVDAEKTGEVGIEEFVSGFARLQGAAKAIDFAVFRGEFEQKMQEQSDALANLKDLLRELKQA